MIFTHGLSTLRTLILSPPHSRLLLLTELILLYTTTHLTAPTLTHLSPRFRISPPHRQRQLSIIPPIIATKLLSISLILTTLSSHPSTTPFSPFAAFQDVALIDELFAYWFLITIAYVFELLYRPSPPLLQGHHLVLQLFNYYYPFYLRQQPQNGLCSGLLFVIIVFGLGIQDTVVDVFVLLYRTVDEGSKGGRIAIRGLGVLQEATRALEWVVLWWYFFTQAREAMKLIGIAELLLWVLLLGGWVWTEVDDWVKLRRMWMKFGKVVAAKRE